MLDKVGEKLERSGIEIKVLKQVKKYLIDKGFDPKTGARNLRRVIRREIEDRIAERIIKDKITDGASVRFSLKKGEIALSLHKKEDSDEIIEENEDKVVLKTEKA
jgi:ATP-dependent Clp protease ATP-binding subunit ClpA